MDKAVRLRFAPSPNGALHLGHALSALLNVDAAAKLGGTYCLRLEDIDRQRCTPEREQAMVDDLVWLGAWPGGKIIRQSQRFAAYHAALDRLRELGLIYPCFASRGEIAAAVAGRADWPHDPDGSPLYPGLWRGAKEDRIASRLSAGETPAWRLDMGNAIARVGLLTWVEYGAGHMEQVSAHPAVWGDVVLARKDVPTSYHLAVVVDDAAEDITHVVRGRDLYHATSLHRLLQSLLALPAPDYLHHRLILGPDQQKLSKSLDATSLSHLRAQGVTIEDIKELIDWNPQQDLAGLATNAKEP